MTKQYYGYNTILGWTSTSRLQYTVTGTWSEIVVMHAKIDGLSRLGCLIKGLTSECTRPKTRQPGMLQTLFGALTSAGCISVFNRGSTIRSDWLIGMNSEAWDEWICWFLSAIRCIYYYNLRCWFLNSICSSLLYHLFLLFLLFRLE